MCVDEKFLLQERSSFPVILKHLPLQWEKRSEPYVQEKTKGQRG